MKIFPIARWKGKTRRRVAVVVMFLPALVALVFVGLAVGIREVAVAAWTLILEDVPAAWRGK